MWQAWQVTPARADGLSRYCSQTISSLMPRLTVTWWQATQNSEAPIWGKVTTLLWIWLPRSSAEVAILSSSLRSSTASNELSVAVLYTGSKIGPGWISRSPFTLPYSSATRWQVMQVIPSRDNCVRSQSGASRGSPNCVPTLWWQRTQNVPIVPWVRSVIRCSNLWNIGEIDA